MPLKGCSSSLCLKITLTRASEGIERSSSLTVALSLSGVGCWEGDSGVESGVQSGVESAVSTGVSIAGAL